MLANKHKARLVILATFALGILTGAFAMNLFGAKPASLSARPSMLEDLAKEVRLDAGQRAQVEQIITETKQQFQELQQQFHPRFVELRNASRTRIRNLLTPEQQALYDEWNRKRDAEREQKFKEGAHHGAK